MPMAAIAIRVCWAASRPGFQHCGGTSGFGTQSNSKTFLEKHWMIKNPEAVLPVPCQRWLKNPQRIVCAEEGRNIHVDARLRLVIEIISNPDILVDWQAVPNIHVMAI